MRRWAGSVGAVVLLAAVWFVGTSGVSSSARVADVEWLGQTRLSAVTVDVEVGEGTVSLAVDNMAPGDRVAGRLDIVNAGTVPLRYTLVAEASDADLGQHFQSSIWPRDADCDEDEDGLLGPDRVLGVDATDPLCVSVTLDRDAPNEVQGRVLTQVLTVVAEHEVEVS